MSDIHPLALAYLRAFAEAHHARGHVVPTGMPSPAMTMHRARDAWQRAGCPLEAGGAALPDQPPPQPGTGDVWADLIAEAERHPRFSPYLLAAMRERRELGITRYGTPLQYGNGRTARVDAAQEFLDGAVYCWQDNDRDGAFAALALADRRIRPHVTPAEARAMLAELLADTPIEQEPPTSTYRLDHEPGSLGDLDLAAEGTIRIERLDDDLVWIRVEHQGGAVVINLHARGGKLRQVVEIEPTHNNPPTHKDPA